MIDLTTTNVLLGIMAAVSLLEALALVAAGVMGLRIYRELTAQVRLLEQRHVAPLAAQAATMMQTVQPILQAVPPIMERVPPIMETVQQITERVQHSTSRVDAAVEGTMHTAEVAVDKVHGGVRKTAGTVVGVVRGVRTAIETFLTDSPHAGDGRRRRNGSRGPMPEPEPRPAPPTAEPF